MSKKNNKRPIKKKHDGWTLLDKAYDLIEDGVFDDLDALFSYYDIDETDAELDEFDAQELAETGSHFEMMRYCLELAREQGIKRFENYFKDIERIKRLSNIMADMIDKILYGDEE
ncbi:MAG: hypothetical protein ACTSVX_02130 [Promethearchaeota archaeon]